jgi:hypothetical protein
MPDASPMLLRLPATADKLGLNPQHLRRAVAAGHISCHRRGRAGWIYFSQADIDAYLQSLRQPAGGDGATGSAS